MGEAANRIQIHLARPGFSLEVDLSWDERVAVVFGPSGSGKTTLFRTVLGLQPGARSLLRLGGVWLDDPERGVCVPVERRQLGWVPQDPTLFPHLSVEENLRFGTGRAGDHGAQALRNSIEVLEIGGLLDRRVDQLSGGERQRVAIARALASGPRALLMDEPLASLDLALRARVLPYLLRLRDRLEIPVLYITHDPDEALLIGEVVIVLDAGRVVATGAPREVLWSRAVLPLSEALGLENVLDARVVETGARESTVETAAGLRLVIPASLRPGESVRLGLRAQDLLLATDLPAHVSARNVFQAIVVHYELRGGDAFVHLEAAERLVAKITPTAVDKLALRAGAPVHVVVKAQAIHRLA
jgi:molybdate transport system ATP-binding protein